MAGEAGMNDEQSFQQTSITEAVPQPARQALILWGVYIILTILLNGTIPFLLGRDMKAWTFSPIKDVLINLVVYSFVFLVVPLILVKGWAIVRQPAFLVPLALAILAMTMRTYVRPVAGLAVFVLAWLHFRYDLSELGFRSRGWRHDVIAVLLIALLSGARRLFSSDPFSFDLVSALLAGLDRLFLNPASTTENLFYFGFLAERLSWKSGKWATALLIGVMYTLHEMTNPEYWYEGQFFPMILIGVTIFTIIYLWRRSVIVIWLGDGLGRFMGRLI